MKTLLTIAMLLVGSTAFASGTRTGDKIHFQKNSAYISVYNKSLCVAADGNYYAQINECAKWENGKRDLCREEVNMWISQPVYSTKTICAKWDNPTKQYKCLEEAVVPYVQLPELTVTTYENSRTQSRVAKVETVTVKSCN